MSLKHSYPLTHFSVYLLALLLAMMAVGALLFLSTYGDPAQTHPDHPAIQQVKADSPQPEGLLWAGWLLGIFQFALLVGCLILGAERNQFISRKLFWGLLAYATVLCVSWSGVVLAYVDYVKQPDQPLFMSLPLPTALMFCVVCVLTLGAPLIYALFFSRWILPPSTLEKFEHLLGQRRDGRKEADSC